ncbi:FAD-dependent oxidoreductase [Streptomyces chromofuscus]|uniref:FAD-dependent oxidoreductase n=1 Tax=Streptomyces chromofuscus TaxID=42881 RepID=UPI00167A6D78|nr:FAD-dependent oxidoreductase [Streptomyces chromofuscus]GGT38159.1 hypothetical protein GCM10010254_67770 [Streptomyces chromofuscus]
MAHIVVMGGGIAGLATAIFLARGAHDVTLFEQDGTEPSGPRDEDFFVRTRPRVPQAVQPHALLGPARSVLRTRTPDVYAHRATSGSPWPRPAKRPASGAEPHCPHARRPPLEGRPSRVG